MSLICDNCGTRDRMKFTKEGHIKTTLTSSVNNLGTFTLDLCDGCVPDEPQSTEEVATLLARVVDEAIKGGLIARAPTKPKAKSRKKAPAKTPPAPEPPATESKDPPPADGSTGSGGDNGADETPTGTPAQTDGQNDAGGMDNPPDPAPDTTGSKDDSDGVGTRVDLTKGPGF